LKFYVNSQWQEEVKIRKEEKGLVTVAGGNSLREEK
jgi:hypothetical protein